MCPSWDTWGHMSPLCPSSPGKAIKLSFFISPKTLSPRFDLEPVYREAELSASLPVLLLLIFMYLFGCTGSQLQHAGSSSVTRDQTWEPCIESMESKPLDPQGSPHVLVSYFQTEIWADSEGIQVFTHTHTHTHTHTSQLNKIILEALFCNLLFHFEYFHMCCRWS